MSFPTLYGSRRLAGSAASPLTAGIAYNAGNLASGCLTLTGNATGGTGPYSYSWEISGPTTVSGGFPEGWEWASGIIGFNGNAASAGTWSGTNPSANQSGGASPSSIDMNVYPPLIPDPYSVVYGGYLATLTVTDAGLDESITTLSFEVHDEGVAANYTQGGAISGGVAFDVTIVDEQTFGGNDGEIIISNITCPANSTHWAMYQAGATANQGLTTYINEASETGLTLMGVSPQDYIFVTYAFGPGRNGDHTVHGPYTVNASPE